mgnify:FL=1
MGVSWGEDAGEDGRRRGGAGAFVIEAAEVKEEATGEREEAERGETAWLEEMVGAAGEIKAAVSKGVGAVLAAEATRCALFTWPGAISFA